jgi:hypothetical protein
MAQGSTRMGTAELQVGDEFAGHRIEGVLGRGGMGVVYRVTDLRLNRPAALKVITPALSADDDFRRRFQRESQVAASVRQQNVVTIFQAGEADGLLFVTMELVHGSDLRAFIADRGRVDLTTTAAIVGQIATALDAAHAASLVHRDVKPANVLIAGGSPLHVYLTDFGLTKRTSSQSGITRTGLFVGTIDYAAPEQIKGWPVDARADVYALGCLLFEMLTGKPPFRRDNEYATMYAHTSDPPPVLSTIVPGTPAALDAVLARALAKDPEQRFPSAGDLARAVQAAVAGQAPLEPERTVATGRAAPPPPPSNAGTLAFPTGAPTAPIAPVAPATPVAPVAPVGPAASATPAEPQAHPVYGYGLDPAYAQPPPPPSYPTAVLPPRRSPWPVIVALLAVVVLAGGAAAFLLTRDSGGGDASPAASTTPAQPPPVSDQGQQDAGPSEATGVRQIVSILNLSAAGVELTRSGQYTSAIENRKLVLRELGGLELAPSLEPSRTLLRRAIQASLAADYELREGGAADSPKNQLATALKKQFTAEFNALAAKHHQPTFAYSDF